MIQPRPYNDADAWAVFRMLDGWDFLEAEAVRGTSASGLSLFGDWRQVEGARILSHVILADRDGRSQPFAVLGLGHTGQAGVAQAALLAKCHRTFRRELAELGAVIRRELPEFCKEHGIFRVEARCWSRHPTASRLLEALGFDHETDMPGFGGDGMGVFRQFAFVPPQPGET